MAGISTRTIETAQRTLSAIAAAESGDAGARGRRLNLHMRQLWPGSRRSSEPARTSLNGSSQPDLAGAIGNGSRPSTEPATTAVTVSEPGSNRSAADRAALVNGTSASPTIEASVGNAPGAGQTSVVRDRDDADAAPGSGAVDSGAGNRPPEPPRPTDPRPDAQDPDDQEPGPWEEKIREEARTRLKRRMGYRLRRNVQHAPGFDFSDEALLREAGLDATDPNAPAQNKALERLTGDIREARLNPEEVAVIIAPLHPDWQNRVRTDLFPSGQDVTAVTETVSPAAASPEPATAAPVTTEAAVSPGTVEPAGEEPQSAVGSAGGDVDTEPSRAQEEPANVMLARELVGQLFPSGTRIGQLETPMLLERLRTPRRPEDMSDSDFADLRRTRENALKNEAALVEVFTILMNNEKLSPDGTLLLSIEPGLRDRIFAGLQEPRRVQVLNALRETHQHIQAHPDAYENPRQLDPALAQWIERNDRSAPQPAAPEAAAGTAAAVSPPDAGEEAQIAAEGARTAAVAAQAKAEADAEQRRQALETETQALLGSYAETRVGPTYPNPEIREGYVITRVAANSLALRVSEARLEEFIDMIPETDTTNARTRIRESFFEQIRKSGADGEWIRGWRDNAYYQTWLTDKEAAEADERAKTWRVPVLGFRIPKPFGGGRTPAPVTAPTAAAPTEVPVPVVPTEDEAAPATVAPPTEAPPAAPEVPQAPTAPTEASTVAPSTEPVEPPLPLEANRSLEPQAIAAIRRVLPYLSTGELTEPQAAYLIRNLQVIINNGLKLGPNEEMGGLGTELESAMSSIPADKKESIEGLLLELIIGNFGRIEEGGANITDQDRDAVIASIGAIGALNLTEMMESIPEVNSYVESLIDKYVE